MQVLSQFDFPELATVKLTEKENINTSLLANDLKTKSHLEGVQTLAFNKSDLDSAESCSHTSVKSVILFNQHKTKCSNNITENIPDKPNSDYKKEDTFVLPKYNKRKIINSHFDHQSKRKFPGPAGLLTGALEIATDESICQIELLSQVKMLLDLH